jgi:hypothetical protein
MLRKIFGLYFGASMLTLGLVYLPEYLCSSLVLFIFWSINAHPWLGLSSGASMLNLWLVYFLEHLCSKESQAKVEHICSRRLTKLSLSIDAPEDKPKLRLRIDAPEDKPS